MSDEIKRLENAQRALNDAREINAAEAINIAASTDSNIDIGMVLGRVQMAHAVSSFADAVSLATLKEIKESKKYRGLKGKVVSAGLILDGGGENEIVLTGTWDEFCKICGTSKSKVDEDLQNLSVFGEKALRSMQTLGVTTKDLRRLRQLPQEDLTTIVEGEVVKVQDRDEALEIIEELSAKHRQEKQSLQTEVTKLTQEKESNDRLLAEKNKKIDSLSKKLETPLTPAQKHQKQEELNRKLLDGLNLASVAVDSGIARLFDAVQTVQDNPHPLDIDQACEDALFRVLERFLSLSADMGISAHVTAHIEQWHLENSYLMDKEG